MTPKPTAAVANATEALFEEHRGLLPPHLNDGRRIKGSNKHQHKREKRQDASSNSYRMDINRSGVSTTVNFRCQVRKERHYKYGATV